MISIKVVHNKINGVYLRYVCYVSSFYKSIIMITLLSKLSVEKAVAITTLESMQIQARWSHQASRDLLKRLWNFDPRQLISALCRTVSVRAPAVRLVTYTFYADVFQRNDYATNRRPLGRCTRFPEGIGEHVWTLNCIGEVAFFIHVRHFSDFM